MQIRALVVGGSSGIGLAAAAAAAKLGARVAIASRSTARLDEALRTIDEGARASETVIVRGTLLSDDSGALVEAAKAGVGILGAGEWLMVREFAASDLVPILPDWTLDTDGGVYLVRPSSEFAPARTEAFVSWIGEQFEHGLPWSRRRVP